MPDIALYCTISAAADCIMLPSVNSAIDHWVQDNFPSFNTGNAVQCLYLVSLCVLILHRLCFLAVKKRWPDNSLPIFKGAQAKEAYEQLQHLVAELVPDCMYSPASLPGITFGKMAIKRLVLDCLNERRRRVHKGHNYEMVILKVRMRFMTVFHCFLLAS